MREDAKRKGGGADGGSDAALVPGGMEWHLAKLAERDVKLGVDSRRGDLVPTHVLSVDHITLKRAFFAWTPPFSPRALLLLLPSRGRVNASFSSLPTTRKSLAPANPLSPLSPLPHLSSSLPPSLSQATPRPPPSALRLLPGDPTSARPSYAAGPRPSRPLGSGREAAPGLR